MSPKNTYSSLRPIIVHLDMLEVARILERSVVPVQLAHPLVQVRVPVADRAQVALEMREVDRVEADLRQKHAFRPEKRKEQVRLTIVTKRRTSASVKRSPMR